jgi:hypothetical protein
MPVTVMSAMQQVHERARQQRKIRQSRQHVARMRDKQVRADSREKQADHQARG